MDPNQSEQKVMIECLTHTNGNVYDAAVNFMEEKFGFEQKIDELEDQIRALKAQRKEMVTQMRQTKPFSWSALHSVLPHVFPAPLHFLAQEKDILHLQSNDVPGMDVICLMDQHVATRINEACSDLNIKQHSKWMVAHCALERFAVTLRTNSSLQSARDAVFILNSCFYHHFRGYTELKMVFPNLILSPAGEPALTPDQIHVKQLFFSEINDVTWNMNDSTFIQPKSLMFFTSIHYHHRISTPFHHPYSCPDSQLTMDYSDFKPAHSKRKNPHPDLNPNPLKFMKSLQ